MPWIYGGLYMKIAVLLSSYNGEKFIEEQVDSILAQKLDGQVDIYVRDDGSTDYTHEILDRLQEEGKLEWYTGPNKKPALSFIDLILHVKDCDYDYYAFCDQDDYWMPDKLQNAVHAIRKKQRPTLYVGNAELVDEHLVSMGRCVYKKAPKLDFYTLSCAGGLLGCTMVFNERLAKIVQHNPPKGPIVMHDFYLALLCKAVGGSIVYDERCLIQYRQHKNNVIGVAHGTVGSLKSRWEDITTAEEVGIALQAKTLLENPMITGKRRQWLIKVARYKRSLHSRISLAASGRTSYVNVNNAVKLRMAILLGNR